MYRRVIVQVLDFVPNGSRSMESFLLLLAEKLRERGWRTIHVFAGEPGAAFGDELRRLDSPYILAKFQLGIGSAYNLGWKLRCYEPDVIHTHFLSMFSPSLPLLKLVAGARRLVCTDHKSGHASKKSLPGRLCARLRGALAGAYIDHCVAVSDFVRRRESRDLYLSAARMQTIYNGVNLTKYAPAHEGKLTRPRELEASRPDDALTIAFVGQLIPEKGLLTLLHALKGLRAEGCSNLRLLVAGQGAQEHELRQFCAAHDVGTVEFLGQIDYVPYLLRTADLVVIPSEWAEACAFSILEALACGACLVASDAGGNAELVGTDGAAGLVFRKGDVADLMDKFRAMISQPARRQTMRSGARARALTRFSIERMIEEYLALFKKIDEEVPCRLRHLQDESVSLTS
jgi:glycosyltransferase involved in cell wall biosynthesis